MKPSESKMRSRLRHTISLSTPLDCRQSQILQTSCEMKRRLFPGCASIISLIVLMSCLLTDLLRYVMIVSIPDTINHQGLERKLILKKNCAEVLNLKFKRLLPVNGYRNYYRERLLGCFSLPLIAWTVGIVTIFIPYFNHKFVSWNTEKRAV